MKLFVFELTGEAEARRPLDECCGGHLEGWEVEEAVTAGSGRRAKEERLRTPEDAPSEPADEPAGSPPKEGSQPTGRPPRQGKPKDLGEVALAWAVMSWFVTLGLVFALSPLMSGYRAGGSAKGLGLLLVLCPAIGPIVLGIRASSGDQAAEDRGTALQGTIAILSGTLLLPAALIAFYVVIVRV